MKILAHGRINKLQRSAGGEGSTVHIALSIKGKVASPDPTGRDCTGTMDLEVAARHGDNIAIGQVLLIEIDTENGESES